MSSSTKNNFIFNAIMWIGVGTHKCWLQLLIFTYGINKLICIADTPEDFITGIESILASTDKTKWLEEVDAFLADNSWDNTWKKMLHHIIVTHNEKYITNQKTKEQAYV